MVVPTKRLWGLVALGIPIAIAGVVIPGAEWLIWPYNLGLAAVTWYSVRLLRGAEIVRVTRSVSPILSVRVANPVQLLVQNLTSSEQRVLVRDEPPETFLTTEREFDLTIQPNGERFLEYKATPRERGDEPFHGTYVRILAPLGLAWVERRLPTEQRATVYPNVKALKDFDLLRQRGHLSLIGVRRARVKGLGTEFESLRDYNDDDFRFIDWKSTARRGKLVVRNFEQERNQAVILCLDAGRHMLAELDGVRKIDYCLDSMIMLMHTAERAGDQVGLLVFNDVIQRYVAPRKGRAQVAAILDTIHGLQAEPVQPDYQGAFSYLAARWKRRSLVVVFTDAENEDQGSELAAAMAQIRRRHILLVVRVADPRLKELAALPVSDDRSLYQRAAATWYSSDRKRAEFRLSAAGIHTLEAEPQDLSAALVSAYLRVKELSLI